MNPVNQICTTEQVIELWTLPNRRPPSLTTIWRRIKTGHIPKPRKMGSVNVFNKAEVIRLRNAAWGIEE